MIGSGGLDRIVESNRETKNVPSDFDEEKRRFLKVLIFLGAEILCGIGFAGCSSKRSQENIEFKPQNPLQKSGYKLIPLPNAPEAPDNVIHDIIKIGKKGFIVRAPGDLTCYIKGRKEDIPSTEVRPGMIITGFSTENGYSWIIGDDTLIEAGYKTFRPQYIEEMSPDISFVNNNMGIYGLIEILGTSGNNVIDCKIYIEQGGGKVTPAIYVQDIQDIKNPKNYERYTIHSKEKLNKMMIEMLSHPTGYKPDPLIPKHGIRFPTQLQDSGDLANKKFIYYKKIYLFLLFLCYIL